jgi:PAS domain S-box-containing protein
LPNRGKGHNTDVTIAVRITADVFVPKDLQRHVLALELAMDLRPVRLRAPTVTRLRPGPLVKRRFQDGIADVVTHGHDSPATAARRSVSRTVDGAAPTLTAIDLQPSPCSKRYLNISRTRRISKSLRRHPVPSSSQSKEETSHQQNPMPDAVRRGGIILESGADCLGICSLLDMPLGKAQMPIDHTAFENFQLPRNTAIFEPTFCGIGVVRSDDIRADPRYGKSAPYHGMPPGHLPVVSYLAVPVVSRSGEVYGGLFFGHDQPGVFTAEAEQLVISIAAHAAIGIDNSQLLKAAEREVIERRQAERVAQQLASIVESSEDAILSMDLGGVITSWNAGAGRLYGYTSNEAIGRPVSFLIPEDRLGEELEILTQIRAGERVDHFETMRRCKHGGLVPVSLRISPLRDDAGAIIGASKIARDISERKRAEEQKDLLVREMAHRVKNLFMVLSSVVALSARSANTADELATGVRARLESLARAHALPLPTPGNPGATEAHVTLKELLGTLLSP